LSQSSFILVYQVFLARSEPFCEVEQKQEQDAHVERHLCEEAQPSPRTHRQNDVLVVESGRDDSFFFLQEHNRGDWHDMRSTLARCFGESACVEQANVAVASEDGELTLARGAHGCARLVVHLFGDGGSPGGLLLVLFLDALPVDDIGRRLCLRAKSVD